MADIGAAESGVAERRWAILGLTGLGVALRVLVPAGFMLAPLGFMLAPLGNGWPIRLCPGVAGNAPWLGVAGAASPSERERDKLRDLLERHGFRVGEARHGGQALMIIRESRFNAVLLDFHLSNMDSFDVLR